MDPKTGKKVEKQPLPPKRTATKSTEINIPKWRFDKVLKAYGEMKAENVKLQTQIDATSTETKEVEELRAQIKDMELQYAEERNTALKNTALANAIAGKAIDEDVVKKLISFDNIKVNEKGEVEGINEQIEGLMKDKPFLWKKPAPVAKKSAAKSEAEGKSFAQQLAERKIAQHEMAEKAKNYF